ncbi:roadblock/LC7 domain-containing protein [candidate division WOR-3 bacterium]|nr:roadblock/LC7 domain-containing protein [candidate division WOR-3 bacterium]
MAKTMSEKLDNLLMELRQSMDGVEGAAIVSTDGLLIAADLSPDMNEDNVTAMAAVMLALCERASKELDRGEFQQLLARTPNGYVALSYIGKDAVLTLITDQSVKLGLLLIKLRQYSKQLEELLVGSA